MKKIISLFLCTLLICSITGVAQKIKSDKETIINSINSFEDDVPVWTVGNLWKYGIDTFIINFNDSEQLIKLDFSMNNLDVEVAGTTTTSYKLDASGKISGSFEYNDGTGMRLSGTLYFTRATGTMLFRQEDLAAEEEDIVIKTLAIITEHPLPLSFPIPLPMTITLNIAHGTPRPFVDFPLYDGKQGILNVSDLSGNIKAESFVLKILHIFFSQVPEEIDITQEISLPALTYNTTVEEVTVAAGTFSAYNIKLFGGLFGSIYYAPDVGNIIKAEAEMDTEGIFVSFHGELKDTNY